MKTIEEEFPQFDYIVVNDGSLDRTGEICNKNQFKMINYSVNLGLKMAFLGGVDYAIKMGYKYVIQYDADGQHNACYINEMLKDAKKTKYAIASGWSDYRYYWPVMILSAFLIPYGMAMISKARNK